VTLTTRARMLGLPSCSPSRPDFFPLLHRSNPSPQSSPSLFRASAGYKNGMPHPLRSIFHRIEGPHRPEEAALKPSPLPSTSPSHTPPSVPHQRCLLPW
jgi:hypothetical protein